MPNLLVRNVADDAVRALQARAGAHGRSTEAEHREILMAALAVPMRRSLADILAAMPDAGIDADYERANPVPKAPRVFAAGRWCPTQSLRWTSRSPPLRCCLI